MIHKKSFLISIILIISIHIFIFAQTNIKDIQAINITKEQPIKINLCKLVIKKEIIKKSILPKRKAINKVVQLITYINRGGTIVYILIGFSLILWKTIVLFIAK